MLEYIVPAITTIIVAILEIHASKERKAAKQDREKSAARAKIREEESRLSMQMMDATLQLSIVTANALTGGHNNGNVEKARKASEKAMKEYEDFHQRLSAHAINKI